MKRQVVEKMSRRGCDYEYDGWFDLDKATYWATGAYEHVYKTVNGQYLRNTWSNHGEGKDLYVKISTVEAASILMKSGRVLDADLMALIADGEV